MLRSQLLARCHHPNLAGAILLCSVQSVESIVDRSDYSINKRHDRQRYSEKILLRSFVYSMEIFDVANEKTFVSELLSMIPLQ